MIETIMKLLGITTYRIDNAVLSIPGQPDLAKSVQSLPWDDAFLAVDLDEFPLDGVSTDQLDALKTFQCNVIRLRRESAYQDEADGLFFAAQADGDSQELWLAKREEIKNRWPYPGKYR